MVGKQSSTDQKYLKGRKDEIFWDYPMAENETTGEGGTSTNVIRLEDLQTTVDALVAKALEMQAGPSRPTGRWPN